MFTLTNQHNFWWPVEVKTPDPDKPGEVQSQTFKLLFQALGDDRASELDKASSGQALSASKRDIAILKEIVLDWSDVVDDDKKIVPFTADALAIATQFPWFRDGAFLAYRNAISGEAARLGN